MEIMSLSSGPSHFIEHLYEWKGYPTHHQHHPPRSELVDAALATPMVVSADYMRRGKCSIHTFVTLPLLSRSLWLRRSSASMLLFCCASIACGLPMAMPGGIDCPRSCMPGACMAPGGKTFWPWRGPMTNVGGSLIGWRGYVRAGWFCEGTMAAQRTLRRREDE